MTRLWAWIVHSALTLALCSGRALAEDSLSVDVASLKAVATFECVGICVNFRGDDNRNATCHLRYRARGEADWKEGHPLFADYRRNEFWGINSRQFRGSLVHLKPGTAYEIRVECDDPEGVKLVGQSSTRAEADKTGLALVSTTWNERIPQGKVQTISDRDTPLVIDNSGTSDAYCVYRAPPGGSTTIAVSDRHNHCIVIDADYVIVRGLTLKGAKEHAVVIAPGRHDIIIEDCKITQWGHHNINAAPTHCAIHADKGTERLIIQHNTIHDPHGGALDWDHGHPAGPAAIEINQSKGRHVIRCNEFYADPKHRFKDILGGADDGGSGSLRQDSDVYGNLMGDCFDDVLEVEGLDINIRIWGNVIKDGFKGIATANIGYSRSHGVDNSLGPIYVFRNVFKNLTSTANKIRGEGGYYFYHNTILRSVADGGEWPSKARSSQITNFGVVKNNVVEASPTAFRYRLVGTEHGRKWFLDYNLYTADRSQLTLRPQWENHGVFGVTPQFEADAYSVYLKSGTSGVDAGERIPNFNDRFADSGPDIGACERGAYSLQVGPRGRSPR